MCLKCRIGTVSLPCLLLTLNPQKFLTIFSFIPIQLGTLIEISTSTPAQGPSPPHVVSIERQRLNILWRSWLQTEAALLSAPLSQWKSKCWMSMTTALSSAKVATLLRCQRTLQRGTKF